LHLSLAAAWNAVKPKKKLSQFDRTLYHEDPRDRSFLASGIKFTPSNLLTYLMRADSGDTRFLHAFYDEMVARDAHLGNEVAKATGAISGARVQVLPYPIRYRTAKARKATGADALPIQIAEFVEEQFRQPDIFLKEAIETWCNGKWKGLGATEQVYEPRAATLPSGGPGTRLARFVPIPSQRFRFEPFGTRLLFQPTGDPSETIPVEDLLDGQLAYLLDHADRPNPARRGELRKVMVGWLSRAYGPGWWQRFVELYGQPIRIAKTAANDQDTINLLNTALASIGANAYAVIPGGATIEFVEAAAGALANPPHQPLLEYHADEMTKVFRGATQTTTIQRDAGSKASASVHKDVSEELDAERAKDIAAVLRNQVAFHLVRFNYGDEAAKRHTPEIILDTQGTPDFGEFSAALVAWKAADLGETTSRAWAHQTAGVPMAEEGMDTLGPATPPQVLGELWKKPGEPSGQPGKKPGEQKQTDSDSDDDCPHCRALDTNARANASAAAHPLAGRDIVAPVRHLIDAAIRERQPLPVLLTRIKHRLRGEVNAPETVDILAAVIAEATFRGMEGERP
jgi:phage gp29-like protein